MKISMTLDPESIKKAAKELKDYAKHLRLAENEISLRMSQTAAEEARTHYDSDVAVEATTHGVLAAGDSVVFQEFGAGARISDPFEDGADVGFEIRRGVYSDLHHGEYAQSGYESWHYRGVEYRYVTPTNALFYGMMKAKEEGPKIAKEVLKEPW